MAWIEEQVAWSKEILSESKMEWRLMNKERLKSAFPLGEKRFCKTIDCMKSRMSSRSQKLLWYKRQPIFNVSSEIVYFGDFYFKTFKLLVEIDGTSHQSQLAKSKDLLRTQLIGLSGIEVLRFTNDEVSGDFRAIEDKFIEAIYRGDGRMKAARQYVAKDYHKVRISRPDIYLA